jgi:hypothetical protein
LHIASKALHQTDGLEGITRHSLKLRDAGCRILDACKKTIKNPHPNNSIRIYAGSGYPAVAAVKGSDGRDKSFPHLYPIFLIPFENGKRNPVFALSILTGPQGNPIDTAEILPAGRRPAD